MEKLVADWARRQIESPSAWQTAVGTGKPFKMQGKSRSGAVNVLLWTGFPTPAGRRLQQDGSVYTRSPNWESTGQYCFLNEYDDRPYIQASVSSIKCPAKLAMFQTLLQRKRRISYFCFGAAGNSYCINSNQLKTCYLHHLPTENISFVDAPGAAWQCVHSYIAFSMTGILEASDLQASTAKSIINSTNSVIFHATATDKLVYSQPRHCTICYFFQIWQIII